MEVAPNYTQKIIDFSMCWAATPEQECPSRVRLYPKHHTDQMNDKMLFFEFLRDRGCTQDLPLTLLTQGEIDQEPDDGRMWFLKGRIGEEGSKVWCYQNKAQLQVLLDRPGVLGQHVIQKEVDQLQLLVGHKVSYRVYGLILDGRCFIYRDFFGKIHPCRYTRDRTDPETHISCTGATTPFLSEDWPDRAAVYPKMKVVAKKVLELFAQDLELKRREQGEDIRTDQQSPAVRYSLIGMDFLVDNMMTPWLIEFNTYPFIWDTRPDVFRLKKQMLTDFCDLVIGQPGTGSQWAKHDGETPSSSSASDAGNVPATQNGFELL